MVEASKWGESVHFHVYTKKHLVTNASPDARDSLLRWRGKREGPKYAVYGGGHLGDNSVASVRAQYGVSLRSVRLRNGKSHE